MAIESTNFFSFLQQTRSPIGLVDQYNLSEIYASDQEDALRNLLLNPEGLNQIFGLSGGDNPVIKEDIRLIGGLESPVVESLGLFHETKSPISFDLSTHVRVGADVGEPGKQSFVSPSQSDNLIVFHGGFAAKNIEYNYLDIDGEPKTTSVSTSRESLFNSQADNDGNYTSASYPGSVLRVRRRGHFNEIKLNKKLFVEKSTLTESPGAIMKIPTYVRTSATPAPAVVVLDAYATKNSPLEVPIQVLGGGSFSLGTISSQDEAYYFGYEIKRKSDNAFVTSNIYQNFAGAKPPSVSVSFNLNGTIGSNVECVLLIYCSPSKVKMLNLAGLGIKENAGKDIGLVGFDALEVIDLSNNGLKNIPTWLKVNYKTLRTINLRGCGFWNNGPIEYFDHQDSIGKSGSSSGGAPLLSAVQILSYSGYHGSSTSHPGVDINNKIEYFDGSLSTIVDGNETKAATTDATKFVKGRAQDVAGSSSCAIDEGHGFRVFSAIESLSLGSSFRFRNADFSKIFPNLLNLDLSRSGGGGERVYGSLPKIHNNNNSAGISYSLNVQTNAGGNIRWVGDNPLFENGDSDADKLQFIGQFKIKNWNTNYCHGASGGICTDDSMVGGKVTSVTQDGLEKYSLVAASGSANYSTAWSGWLDNLETLNLYQSDVIVNLAEGPSLQWKKLKTVDVRFGRNYSTSIKIRYNQTTDGGSTSYDVGDMDAYDRLYANSLTSIQAYASGWSGRLFSIADNAGALTSMQMGKGAWDPYIDNEGNKYILPGNFVQTDKTSIEEQSKLKSLSLHYLISGSSKELQFRPDEFTNMGNLTFLEIRESYYWGVFPQFVNQTKSTSTINCYLGSNRFYDLQNLGANVNNRFGTIWAPSQGISRGGAIIPSFDTGSDNNPRLYNVQFYSALAPTYSSAWNVSAKRSKKVFNALYGVPGVPTSSQSVDPVAWGDIAQERNSVPTTTFTSRTRNLTQAESRVLYADTDTNLQNYIRVGDNVFTTPTGGSPIGKVNQVKNTAGSYVVISELKNYTGQTLYFQRAGVEVKEYWNNCIALRYLYFQNCSMVGTIPEFEGNSGKLERIRFQSNLFTTYVPGTLGNITGQTVGKTSRPRLREFNLSNNPISLTSVRDIIEDAYSMAKYFGSNLYGITIDLRNTKADIANGTLSNYTDQEVFYLGSPGNPGSDPPIAGSPDPLLSKFNQLGSGNIYSKVNIILN